MIAAVAHPVACPIPHRHPEVTHRVTHTPTGDRLADLQEGLLREVLRLMEALRDTAELLDDARVVVTVQVREDAATRLSPCTHKDT
jgi:hypothetical protein